MKTLNDKRKRKIFIVMVSIVLVLVIIAGISIAYVSDYYRAEQKAIEAFAPVNDGCYRMEK